MRLKSKRLFLKPLSAAELKGNYVFWLNDPVVCRYNSHGEKKYTLSMAKKFIKNLKKDSSKEVWAVYLKEKNLHIGNVSLQRIDLKNKSVEIAYLFGEKDYWGQGYAREASQVLLKRVFKVMKLHRVYLGTNINNLPMRKLAQNLGFKKEGILKDALLKDGAFQNVAIFGLLKDDLETL